MPLYAAEDLRKFTEEVFKKAGVPDDTLEILTNHLINASLTGTDSHGIMRISEYVISVREGLFRGRSPIKIDPAAKMEIARDNGSTLVVNGNWNFGQVTAWKSMGLAMERAKKHGISTVSCYNTAHIGRLGEYATQAAQGDMVGIIFCNIGTSVAPFGGYEKKLSTNPLSIGIPTGGEVPFVMDFATSCQAEGKVRNYNISGKKIPLGWVVDSEGRPTDNPGDLYNGGALLPFGGQQGHKGFALSLVVQILSATLSGCSFPGYPGYEMGSSGTVMIALDVSKFTPIDEFKKAVGFFLKDIKGSKKQEGVDEIFIPGEPEFRTRKKRIVEGVEISDGLLEQLGETADSLGVAIGEFLKAKS